MFAKPLKSISSTFYEQLFANFLLPKQLQAKTLRRGNLRKTILYKIAACKTAWGQFHHRVYEQLLLEQVPKEQKAA